MCMTYLAGNGQNANSQEASLDLLMVAMDIQTIWTYLGIKLIEIVIMDTYGM